MRRTLLLVSNIALLCLTACNQGSRLIGKNARNVDHPQDPSDPQGTFIQGFWENPVTHSILRIGFSTPTSPKSLSERDLDDEKPPRSRTSRTSSEDRITHSLALLMPTHWSEPDRGDIPLIDPHLEVLLTPDSTKTVWQGRQKLDSKNSPRISEIAVEVRPQFKAGTNDFAQQIKVKWKFSYRNNSAAKETEQLLSAAQVEDFARNQFFTDLKTKTLDFLTANYFEILCPISISSEKGVADFADLIKIQNNKCATLLFKESFCRWDNNDLYRAYTATILNANPEMESLLRNYTAQCDNGKKASSVGKFFECTSETGECDTRPVVGLLRNLIAETFGQYISEDYKFLIKLRKNDLLKQVLPILKKDFTQKGAIVLDPDSRFLFRSLLALRFEEEAALLARDSAHPDLWKNFILSAEIRGTDKMKPILWSLFNSESDISNIYAPSLLNLKKKDSPLYLAFQDSQTLWREQTEDQQLELLILAGENLDCESFISLIKELPKNILETHKGRLKEELRKQIGQRNSLVSNRSKDILERNKHRRALLELQKILDELK